MEIINKIRNKQSDWYGKRQPVIAFLGDSVTHGCFDLYVKENKVETVVDMEKAYHNKVKQLLNILYPEVVITTVNAGISGDRADAAKERLKRDVLSYNPDLVVVCYGLNDSMNEEKGLSVYIESLKSIFNDIRDNGAEVIFMTPSIRTSKIDIDFKDPLITECVQKVIDNEKAGWLTKYIEAARKLCEEMNVVVCDCNKIWNCLADNDVCINNLLSNRVNHPTEEMHWLFAYELVKTMFMK